MAEVTIPYLRDNHLIDRAAIRRDLWLILQAFMASPNIARTWAHAWHDDVSHVLNLDSEFQEAEITKSLISSCINIRILDDAGDVADNNFVCGSLCRDFENVPDASIALTFREACNKVIHATRVRWDVERTDGRDLRPNDDEPKFITPRLYLYGEFNGRTWRAELLIKDFIEAAAALTS